MIMSETPRRLTLEDLIQESNPQTDDKRKQSSDLIFETVDASTVKAESKAGGGVIPHLPFFLTLLNTGEKRCM